jgi:hypothetical protein
LRYSMFSNLDYTDQHDFSKLPNLLKKNSEKVPFGMNDTFTNISVILFKRDRFNQIR